MITLSYLGRKASEAVASLPHVCHDLRFLSRIVTVRWEFFASRTDVRLPHSAVFGWGCIAGMTFPAYLLCYSKTKKFPVVAKPMETIA